MGQLIKLGLSSAVKRTLAMKAKDAIIRYNSKLIDARKLPFDKRIQRVKDIMAKLKRKQMMAKTAAPYFIYAELPKETKEALPQISLPKSNYHATIKFLGELNPEQVSIVNRSLGTILQGQKDFTVKVKGYDTFPTNGGGIYHAKLNNPLRLNQLKEKSNLAFGLDPRHPEYNPHITLDYHGGGTKPNPPIKKFKVNTISLAQVDGQMPYHPVASYTLPKRTRIEQFTDWIRNLNT